MLRLIGKLLLGLVVTVLLTVGAFGGYRAWRQHEGARALAITEPLGIDEGLFIDVRGSQQWVTVRSKDRSHPVLLVVHGGPGAALSPLAGAFLPYERDWTIVQWDQPGAGRTFVRAGNTLPADTTVASIAADGIAVTERVAQRLGQRQVVLLGLSFGSVVALEMVRTRPDLFAAYVGTGLFVHRDDGREITHRRLLALARARNNPDAVAELEAIGAPYSQPAAFRTLSRWIDVLGSAEEATSASRFAELLFVPRQTLSELASYFGGYVASDEHFDLGEMDLRKSATSYAVPIFVIQGGEDYDTPVELAQSYVDSMSAPRKELVILPRGGHTVLVDDAAGFAAALDRLVLPLVRTTVR